MTVLIAGAHGFIGFSVAKRLLDAGHAVIGVDKMRDAVSPKGARVEKLAQYRNYRFIDLNLSDQVATDTLFARERFDQAVFLAGQYSQPHSRAHVNACMAGNVLAVTNFFEAAAAKKLKRVVYASSTFVQDGVRPRTMYGATKEWAELCASVYTATFGLETIGFRFGSVYGPYIRPDVGIAGVARHVRKGAELRVDQGAFTYKVAFVYIDDAVECVMRALEQPVKKPYQVLTCVAEDEPRDMFQIMELLEAEFGRSAKRIGERQPEQVATIPTAACAAMREALGYAPTTKIADGIREFVKWYTAPLG